MEEDGSGTLKANIIIPEGTMKMMDMIFGRFMEAMAGALEGAEGAEEERFPGLLVEQMFGSRDELLKEAEAAGVNIEILQFDKTRMEGGLRVDYKLNFDNIHRLMASDIPASRLAFSVNGQGGWVCKPQQDPNELAESKQQVQQFHAFKESEEFRQMDPLTAKLITDALENFSMETTITLPFPVKQYVPPFEAVDERTVRLVFSGDFFSDPDVLNTFYDRSRGSVVVWENPSGEVGEEAAGHSSEDNTAAERDIVKIHLTSGVIMEGRQIEKTGEAVKIDMDGITATYYMDEIERIE